MPMGCPSSCKTFEMFSSSIERIAKKKLHIDHILHLLDDFLIVSPTHNLCKQQLDLFLMLCHYLGIPMALEKTLGPFSTISFAGIELDSVKMEARLLPDKLAKCQDLISGFLRCRKVTLREIQSLTRLLNFACSVVVPGRKFLRRLIDLTLGIRSPRFLIRVTREVKEDLKVWQQFLRASFNGRSFFLSDVWSNSHQLQLYTAASGAIGFDAVFGKNWCYGKWPESWRHRNIAFLECYPIVLSLHLWGHAFKDQRVLFFTDNEASVNVINKQTCRGKDLMLFVRKLVLVCLHYNICFKAKHVPGVQNKLADSLSRLQLQTFKQLAPAYMHEVPTVIPPHLQPLSQPSSIPTYQRAWRLFLQFFISTFQLPFRAMPISPSVLALFIAYLFRSQYAPSTVMTYVSALGFCHKLQGFSDPSKVFYVSQMLKGFNKVGFRLDSRLPITLPILDKLLSVAPSLVGSSYQICQFQAMCSLAFFAFLRIGEMTSPSNFAD